jgi:hypothetical protein
VSLGVYATVVQQEGYREAKSETTKQMLPELLGNTESPFDLQFTTPEGEEVDGAFLLMVSNNPYVLNLSPDLSQRRRLDSGHLGVFAVTAATGAQAAQVVTLALAGRGSKSGHAFQFDCETFEVRSRSGTAFAGIDGEALELPTPLRFRVTCTSMICSRWRQEQPLLCPEAGRGATPGYISPSGKNVTQLVCIEAPSAMMVAPHT